eukprot:scaffold13333_cov252-Alexandrium_tamarense.AAC.1
MTLAQIKSHTSSLLVRQTRTASAQSLFGTIIQFRQPNTHPIIINHEVLFRFIHCRRHEPSRFLSFWKERRRYQRESCACLPLL